MLQNMSFTDNIFRKERVSTGWADLQPEPPGSASWELQNVPLFRGARDSNSLLPAC